MDRYSNYIADIHPSTIIVIIDQSRVILDEVPLVYDRLIIDSKNCLLLFHNLSNDATLWAEMWHTVRADTKTRR